MFTNLWPAQRNLFFHLERSRVAAAGGCTGLIPEEKQQNILTWWFKGPCGLSLTYRPLLHSGGLNPHQYDSRLHRATIPLE